MEKINVLSLFDGISCGQLALQNVGIEVENYYASEICKNAITITQNNFPKTIQIGCVKKIDFSILPKIDLLIGGSPCQDLSIAKANREGLNGERSGLFWEYVKALKKTNPRYFLLENNYGMPQEAKDIITEQLGVEPIFINSSLFSAQSRKRYYWTNIPFDKNIVDCNVLLQDILEYGTTPRTKSKTVRIGGGVRLGEQA